MNSKEARLSNILLAVTGGLSLALLALPTHSLVVSFKTLLAYSLRPMPLAAHRGIERTRDVPSNVLELLRADQENRRLREEFKAVELLQNRLERTEEENERLRSLLGLGAPPGWTHVWASLLHREPAHWHRFVVIDKGRADGVEPNAPVLAAQGGAVGVVGRVAEVSEGSSVVLLVTDDLSSVAVELEGGWSALAEGGGRPYLVLNYVSERAKLAPGQSVATSELSPTFPRGLSVGRVAEVHPPDPFLAFQTARIEPTVELGRLKEVMVLRRGPRTRVRDAEARAEVLE